MSTSQIESIEVQTGIDPRYSVIWLHGLGADGHDFLGLVPELNIPDTMSVRFIFPHAPMRPITINGGMVMRGWYDITDMSINRQEDGDGIQASANLVGELIDQENSRGVDSAHVILAGFSQGGAIALQAGLRHPERLAGIVALSTYLPLANSLEAERQSANFDCRIFMAHGMHDPVVPISTAEKSHQQLKDLGYSVEWFSYPMEHSVSPAEIRDIKNFFHSLLL